MASATEVLPLCVRSRCSSRKGWLSRLMRPPKMRMRTLSSERSLVGHLHSKCSWPSKKCRKQENLKRRYQRKFRTIY